jgi:hypothetical protein
MASTTYQDTLESLSLQGEVEVVKEVDRKHRMANSGDGQAGSVVGRNSRWNCY